MRILATIVLSCGLAASCAPPPGAPGPAAPAETVSTAPGAFLFDCVGTGAARALERGGVAVGTAVDRAIDACQPRFDTYVRLLAQQTGTPEAAVDREAVRRGIVDRFVAYFRQHYV